MERDRSTSRLAFSSPVFFFRLPLLLDLVSCILAALSVLLIFILADLLELDPDPDPDPAAAPSSGAALAPAAGPVAGMTLCWLQLKEEVDDPVDTMALGQS